MVPVTSLAMPILLSAVIVFVASFVMHMLLPYHRGDFMKIPKEDDFLDSMRRLSLSPGDYAAPRPSSQAGMREPEFVEKMKKGPIVLMTITAGGPPSLATNLAQWFVYSVVVSFFAAYIAGRAVGPGANYLMVFRFIGSTAFMGYSFALFQNSIWYHRRWSTTLKSAFDGLVYGLLTAGTFGWLWPR
jgi:hypothetical protein